MKCLRPVYNVLYYIIYTLLAWLVKLLFPVKAIGRENLIKGAGFVLAPGHLYAIDPMFVLLARGFGKKCLIMGKEELFQLNPFVNFFWNIVGAFPVDRGAGDRSLLDKAIAEVEKGRGLLIFPEGTRSKDGKLHRLKSGAFVVAQQAGAPMIPCRVHYAAGGPKIFRRTTVAFGKPVAMEEMGLTGEYSPKALRAAKTIFTQRLEDVQKLLPPVVPMPGRAPVAEQAALPPDAQPRTGQPDSQPPKE